MRTPSNLPPGVSDRDIEDWQEQEWIEDSKTLEAAREPKQGHTPGPWVVNHNSIGSAHIESEHEHGWANNGWIIAEAKGDDPERQANARLIAAAPDLLAALEAAHAIIESMRAEHRLHGQITSASADYLHHAKPLIDAALSKARGEQ